jgi:hypothetical protein
VFDDLPHSSQRVEWSVKERMQTTEQRDDTLIPQEWDGVLESARRELHIARPVQHRTWIAVGRGQIAAARHVEQTLAY